MPLYHFTCSHGRALIGSPGVLEPHWGFVWLTDLARPPREAVGLTSQILDCDRMEFRYRATANGTVVPWTTVRRRYPREWVEGLESAPGALLRHWYVSPVPVPAVLDQGRG